MSDFRANQLAFIAAIRSSDQQIPADVAPERMAVYRELFFNNIQNFVNSAFPVLRSILPASLWQQNLRKFFAEATLTSPYFLNIAESYLDWLSNEPQSLPFAVELAHYEWAELYVATLPCPLLEPFDLTGPLQLADCALVLSYQFPVHQISPDYQPIDPTADGCYLLVYRNIDDQVRFIALNQLTAALLTLLSERPGLDFSELTQQFSELLPQLAGVEWLAQARSLCFDLAQKASFNLHKLLKNDYDVDPLFLRWNTGMADENFKESFNVFQLLGFVVVFVSLLCLPPIVTWSRILG